MTSHGGSTQIGPAPDGWQGYGQILLANVLPLKENSFTLYYQDLVALASDAEDVYTVTVT
jgi:hypothetical protein